MTAQKRVGDLTSIVEAEDIPQELALLFERLRGAIEEMATAAHPSLKRTPEDQTTAEERANAERRRAIGAANALEFEIAPLLEGLSLAQIVGKIKAEAGAEYRRVMTLPPREMLPLTSEVAILPRQRATIATRPHRAAMRINTLVCASPDFLIHDIRIGARSQFAQAGAIPSAVLMPSGIGPIGPHLNFETIQTAMDLVIEVEYIGANPAGEAFRAVALGETECTAEAEGVAIGAQIGNAMVGMIGTATLNASIRAFSPLRCNICLAQNNPGASWCGECVAPLV